MILKCVQIFSLGLLGVLMLTADVHAQQSSTRSTASAKQEPRFEIAFDAKLELTNKERLTLIDFVRVRKGNSDFYNTLSDIEIPAYLRERETLSASDIRNLIVDLQEQNAKLKELNPKLLISSQIHIEYVSNASKEHIARLIQNWVASQCQDCEVQISSVTGADKIKGKSWGLDFSTQKIGSSILIPVVTENQQLQYVTAQLKIMKKAWVANRILDFNTRIEPGDIEEKIADVSFAKEQPAQRESIVGALVNRSLRPGQAVFPSDLKREAAIKRNQIVKAVAGEGDLEVSSSVIADDIGFIGDMIKVKSLEGNKLMSGQVIDRGVVRLQ